MAVDNYRSRETTEATKTHAFMVWTSHLERSAHSKQITYHPMRLFSHSKPGCLRHEVMPWGILQRGAEMGGSTPQSPMHLAESFANVTCDKSLPKSTSLHHALDQATMATWTARIRDSILPKIYPADISRCSFRHDQGSKSDQVWSLQTDGFGTSVARGHLRIVHQVVQCKNV